jgi:hypothetical protein
MRDVIRRRIGMTSYGSRSCGAHQEIFDRGLIEAVEGPLQRLQPQHLARRTQGDL